MILLNLHQEKTRKALSTARETPNGYILLNEDVSIEHFEAVYALEKTQWEFPFTPTTAPGNSISLMDLMMPRPYVHILADATT